MQQSVLVHITAAHVPFHSQRIFAWRADECCSIVGCILHAYACIDVCGSGLAPQAKYRNRFHQPRGAQRVCASVCARVLYEHGFARASAFKFIFTQLLAFESWIVGKLYKRS